MLLGSVIQHRQANAPVGLGRASGSALWGRGIRRREREPVFPDHGFGVILQPDFLLQACLHPYLSPSHYHSLTVSIFVFVFLSSSVTPLSSPDVPAIILLASPLPPSLDTTVIFPSCRYHLSIPLTSIVYFGKHIN